MKFDQVPPSLSLSSIPDHESWIVTMWHFGYDSPNEYTGDEFEVAWEDGQMPYFGYTLSI